MLIDSPRLTPGDRKHWARMEAFDARLATSPLLDTLAEEGRAAIAEWRAAGPGIIGTSWGKDSVVAAHLTYQVDPTIPLVWVRTDPYEMPECEQVRDAYLAAHPDTRYDERRAVLRVPKRGEPGYEAHLADPNQKGQDVLGEMIKERYISGVRGDESRVRRMSVGRHGAVTKNTCRPLASWSAVDVFAYLYRENLPVHPAYAATYGGRLDRRLLRVHQLCSPPPPNLTVVLHHWEDHYYGDTIAAAHAIRYAMTGETSEGNA